MTQRRRGPRDDTGVSTREALAAPLRRRTLLVLMDAPGPLPRPLLASRIVARDWGDGAGHRQWTDTDAVIAALHHTHLPKLAAANLVTVSRDDVVTLTSRAMTDDLIRAYYDGSGSLTSLFEPPSDVQDQADSD